MQPTRFANRCRPVTLTAAAAGLAVAAIVLAAGRPAGADLLQPLVTLGPVTVANGTATLSGSLGGNPSSATLTVNGQPVSLGTGGSFSTTVDLTGTSELAISVTNPTSGDVVTTRIPLTSNVIGPNGVIPDTILDQLEQAAISITKPIEGFEVLDGKPLAIAGKVADGSTLSSLTVNGADVLDKLSPSGAFEQTLPGSSDTVTVTATDKQGVSQSSTSNVQHASSVIATPAGASVSAQGANGVRVASVRYKTKAVRTTKRLVMTVTVKDRLGRLVRDAAVRVRVANFQVGKKLVASGQQAKYSSRVGTASFTVRLTRKALGRRVFMVAVAKTPSASAQKTTSVRLPRAARRAR
jgi:hypothetical protein